MSNIGITLRTHLLEDRGELRECLDVRMVQLLSEIGLNPVLLSSAFKPAECIDRFDLKWVLLSGGEDIGKNPARDEFEIALIKRAISTGTGLLGVCRGAQLLNRFFGGSTTRLTGHVATRHELLPNPFFGKISVNSFHDHVITYETLGHDLELVATTSDGSVEAFKHSTLKIFGIMWHPERVSFKSEESASSIRSIFDRVLK